MNGNSKTMPAFKRVNPNGRKPKLTEALISDICNMLRAGSYVETAAAVAGVPKETLHLWLRKGRYHKGDKTSEVKNNIYGKLIHSVNKAIEECVVRDLLVIDRAANPTMKAIMLKNEAGEQLYDKDRLPHFIKPQLPDWSAAAWRLERRHSKAWSKVEKIEQSGSLSVGPPSEEMLDEAKLKAAMDKLESDF